jgi:Sulfite exporter TauE/SafE
MFESMLDPILIFVCVVFALAGFAKGAIGLGLPTISMGLLAVVMPPVHAAAILILPSLVTNVWQMLAGPALTVVVHRLWPMMLAVCLGTWVSGQATLAQVQKYIEAADQRRWPKQRWRSVIVANRWLETSLLAPDGKRAAEGCGRFEWSPLRGMASSAAANSGITRTVSTLLVVRRVLCGRQVKKPSRKCWRPIR